MNTEDIKIEKGLPMPRSITKAGQTKLTETLHSMEVGDSFVIPDYEIKRVAMVKSSIYQWAHRNEKLFRILREHSLPGERYRVWRME